MRTALCPWNKNNTRFFPLGLHTPGQLNVRGAPAEAGHLEEYMLAIKCCETQKGAKDGDHLLPVAVLVPVLIARTGLDRLPQRCTATGVIPLYLWPGFAPYKSQTRPVLKGGLSDFFPAVAGVIRCLGTGEGTPRGTAPGRTGGSWVKAPCSRTLSLSAYLRL